MHHDEGIADVSRVEIGQSESRMCAVEVYCMSDGVFTISDISISADTVDARYAGTLLQPLNMISSFVLNII